MTKRIFLKSKRISLFTDGLQSKRFKGGKYKRIWDDGWNRNENEDKPGKAGFQTFKHCYDAGVNFKNTGDNLIIAPQFICEKKQMKL